MAATNTFQESNNHPGMMLGTVRLRLMYRTRESLERYWPQVFPGEILPDDHVFIGLYKVATLVESLIAPKQGRSKAITQAAQQLLNEINAPAFTAPASEVLENIPEPAPEPVETSTQVPERPTQPLPEPAETSGPVPERPQRPAPEVEGVGAVGIGAWFRKITALKKTDIVFATNLVVADYGLCVLFEEMGAAWALVYTLVSLDALATAKERHLQETAKITMRAIWVMEVISFLIHLAMFNGKAWKAALAGRLPFDVWLHRDYPFYVALLLAALFSGFAIYTVWITAQKVTEKKNAANYEAIHGLQY